MDWAELAKELPVSHSMRVNCPSCGGKKTCSITNKGNRYVRLCFRCKEADSASAPAMTPQERRELIIAAQAFEATEPTLPQDFTPNIPVPGLLWLSKAGLNYHDIQEHRIGWSPELRRVVLPVYNRRNILAGVQARSVEPFVKPKYLNQIWSGPRPMFRTDLQKRGRNSTVVLTEDIMSACRIAKTGTTAFSLLGTNLMDAPIAEIDESPYDDVVVWMDSDEAGQDARRTMLRQLSAVGINARSVYSELDPKLLDLEAINEHLQL